MNGLISIPTTEGLGSGHATPAAFLAEAKASPVYAIGSLTTVAELLPYLEALAQALAHDCPAMSGVKNKTAPDTRTQTLLAEMIAAAGG